MIRRTTVGYPALFALATWLSSAAAFAQAPQASPVAQDKAAQPAKKAADPGAKPEDKGEKAGAKSDEKAAQPEMNPDKAENKTGEPTVNAIDRKEPDDAKLKERMQRRTHQQDVERAKIAAALHGQPMTEALNQELSRHARRLARLERIKALAVEAKDTAVIERVTKLIDKENARHDKFTTNVESRDDKGKDDKGKDEKGGVK